MILAMTERESTSQPTNEAINDVLTQRVLDEVRLESSRWIGHFNLGDVDACVAGYTPEAEMRATPFGVFHGHAAIDGFWRPFIASGASELEYSDVELRVVDPTTVLLSAKWRMNVGRGVITEERWVKQADGRWRLVFDAFEVQEKFT